MLIVLNELKNNGEDRMMNFNALKSVITDYTIVNEKNQPRRTAKKVVKFMFCTITTYPVKIETGDRRYVVLRSKLRGKCPQLLVQFQIIDPKKTSKISLLELEDILAKNGLKLGDQEFLTLFRRFQFLDTDKFNYQEFIEALV